MGAQRPLFVFLDEGGDLGFTPDGSRFFTLTSLATFNPIAGYEALNRYRYACLASSHNLDTEYFHCADDNRYVRKRVFEIIASHQSAFRYDSLIVEKRKTHPSVQAQERFYPEMLGYLLCHVLKSVAGTAGEFIIVTDELPLKRKRRAIEKAVRTTLSRMLPDGLRYRLYHHASRAHAGLQIADYANWAILRKWERGETAFYDLIKPRLASEFEIFRSGGVLYY